MMEATEEWHAGSALRRAQGRTAESKRDMKFKPGDRIVIARGPGQGVAGTVCALRPGEVIDVGRIIVHFDQEPGTRYVYDQAAFDYEAIPMKPPRPSVLERRGGRKSDGRGGFYLTTAPGVVFGTTRVGGTCDGFKFSFLPALASLRHPSRVP